MRLFGFQITRAEKTLSPPADSRGWWTMVRESFTGAWQRNVTVNFDSVMSHHAVFACQTLIASDISKLRVKLVAQDSDGIWGETKNPAYSPVLRKPNHFQTRIQFWESWVLSKLSRGNTYVLKRRDGRGVVTGLYVLDPNRCRPLVSDDGQVFYQLDTDNIVGLDEQTVVPAREIIHDRFNCLFHPLVGISPIYANGLAATHGLNIQNYGATFFANGARPSGILMAPGDIKQEDADRLRIAWDEKFTGENRGKIAVLGGGMKYEAMTMTSEEAQLIEQLKWNGEIICSTYHVPSYKIGLGQQPTYSNIQSLNVEYYSQCLQVLIEAIEVCLDEGLGTGEMLGTEFDLDNLLRMDSVAQMEVLKNSAGILAPNEMRAKLDRKPAKGGDSPMVQQQNFSLEALAKRDAQDDPFAKDSGNSVSAEPPPQTEDQKTIVQMFPKYAAASLRDELGLLKRAA